MQVASLRRGSGPWEMRVRFTLAGLASREQAPRCVALVQNDICARPQMSGLYSEEVSDSLRAFKAVEKVSDRWRGPR
eukprot:2288646-Prymnesium_polylepis.1